MFIAQGDNSDRFGRRLTLSVFSLGTLVPSLWIGWRLHAEGWTHPVEAGPDGALGTPGLDCTGDAATGGTFFALAAIDDESTTHDWGHTLLPEENLSIDLKVGWAPGSDG